MSWRLPVQGRCASRMTFQPMGKAEMTMCPSGIGNSLTGLEDRDHGNHFASRLLSEVLVPCRLLIIFSSAVNCLVYMSDSFSMRLSSSSRSFS